MRYLIVLATLAVALVATGAASAGGWASVQVDPLPTGIDAGETWRTEITVLQHGVTPLEGLSPVLTIRNDQSGAAQSFKASPTGETGVYRTGVVFPEAGQWNVEVESGFWGEGRLTFGPVTIGAPPAGITNPGSFPVVPVAVIALVLAALAAATLGMRRRWRPTPASPS